MIRNSHLTKLVRQAAFGLTGLVLATTAAAHHPILGKFDAEQPMTLRGIVTKLDWRNPHAHIFMNVADGDSVQNWAIELQSPITLESGGWNSNSLHPGDAVIVEGTRARNGSRQVWGEVVRLAGSGARILHAERRLPVLSGPARPAPRWPNGRIALGATPDVVDGYWSFPTETALVEDGASVEMNEYGLLADIDDADRVAPMQPWALALYKHRQERFLQDDPMYLHCKPPGGVRQYQSDFGFQLIEDHKTQRVFVLMGSGNRNYRIIYLDGRDQVGLVGGDDDNPLYYGRAAGHWDGDTLVVDTTGFNEDFWFTQGGLPHTDRLTLIERFTRTSFDTLRYEVTVDDPGAYTRRWTASWTLHWVGGGELPAHFCQNNRS